MTYLGPTDQITPRQRGTVWVLMLLVPFAAALLAAIVLILIDSTWGSIGLPGQQPESTTTFWLTIWIVFAVTAIGAMLFLWFLPRPDRSGRAFVLAALVICPECGSRTTPELGECQWCDATLDGAESVGSIIEAEEAEMAAGRAAAAEARAEAREARAERRAARKDERAAAREAKEAEKEEKRKAKEAEKAADDDESDDGDAEDAGTEDAGAEDASAHDEDSADTEEPEGEAEADEGSGGDSGEQDEPDEDPDAVDVVIEGESEASSADEEAEETPADDSGDDPDPDPEEEESGQLSLDESLVEDPDGPESGDPWVSGDS